MSSVVYLDSLPACLCSQTVISRMLFPQAGSGWSCQEAKWAALLVGSRDCAPWQHREESTAAGTEGKGAVHSAQGRKNQNPIFFSVPSLWHSEHQWCAFWREASAVPASRHSAGCQREVVWRCSWKDMPCSFLSKFMFLTLQTRKAGFFLVFLWMWMKHLPHENTSTIGTKKPIQRNLLPLAFPPLESWSLVGTVFSVSCKAFPV